MFTDVLEQGKIAALSFLDLFIDDLHDTALIIRVRIDACAAISLQRPAIEIIGNRAIRAQYTDRFANRFRIAGSFIIIG